MLEILFILLNKGIALFILIVPTIYLILIIKYFWKEIRESKLQLLAFIFLTIIFLNKLLFGPFSLAQKDFNDLQIPFFTFFSESLKKLDTPLLNESFCGEFDNFSTPIAGFFNSFNFLFLLFSNSYTAFNFYIFAQILLCLVFSYIFLRKFNFHKLSSFTGAIIFSFNAFVIMRLSPGVGIEYLFTYKWIPIIFALLISFYEKKTIKEIVLLSISCAFLFEGNPNIVISSGFLILLFTIFNYKKFDKRLLLIPLFSFCIFSIKILPALTLFNDSNSRFSNISAGWRTSNYDLDMFPSILLPIKVNFSIGYFTPGLIAMIIFILGLIVSLKVKSEHKYYYFFLILLAPILTIENPIFYAFYSLPILNKITIIPSFTILYILPIIYFVSFFIDSIKVRPILYIVPLAIFTEILLGPSIFGPNSYSFNFAKINYLVEPYDFAHFKALQHKEGSYYILDRPDLFMYPYSSVIYKLTSQNTPAYFYGCKQKTNVQNYSDYVLTMAPVDTTNYAFVEKVSLSSILKHDSHSVFEHKNDYIKLYDTGWNDDIYIYKNTNKTASSINKVESNPYLLKIDNPNNLATLQTDLSYSKMFYSKNNEKLYSNEDGYLAIDNINTPQITIFYVNHLFYIGFIISFCSFSVILYLNKKE